MTAAESGLICREGETEPAHLEEPLKSHQTPEYGHNGPTMRTDGSQRVAPLPLAPAGDTAVRSIQSDTGVSASFPCAFCRILTQPQWGYSVSRMSDSESASKKGQVASLFPLNNPRRRSLCKGRHGFPIQMKENRKAIGF